MSTPVSTRLFVPKAREPFFDFRDRGKEIELRTYGRMFTEKHVFFGREAELRLGYSGHESIWGIIGVVMGGSLQDISK